jgi:pyruvate,orthophosphate dikinase
MVKSKALEVNIADYHVDVTIDDKYAVLQEVMSKYFGIMEGLNTFLKELSHPYRNWQFIVQEARGYSLNYFHLLKNHPKGPDAAKLFVDIFVNAIQLTNDDQIRVDAVDHLLLFLQKIIKDSGSDLERFIPALNDSFDRISNFSDEHFFLFVKSFYQVDELATMLLKNSSGITIDYEAINLLLSKYFTSTYFYWLSEGDPERWLEREAEGIEQLDDLGKYFEDISHNKIKQLKTELDSIATSKHVAPGDVLKKLLSLPGYNRFVKTYNEIPQILLGEIDHDGLGNQWKLIFLLMIMNVSGLSMIHEETLREINRTLSWIIVNEKYQNIDKLIQKTFSILKEVTNRFPTTALNCVLNMGKGVYKKNDSDLIDFFIDSLLDLGFHSPMIKGVGNDWQIQVNSAHILNIRIWLELIGFNPKFSPRLLSYLIIHLSLCGVFIKDTDLFPRDITRFLNSGVGPVYNLTKQFARLLPVFFNEIGAEGKLRDISTRIDEITQRKDALIHFLRKQSHVESSNRIVDFMEAILRFWETRKKGPLKLFVPPNIFQKIKTRGPYINGVNKVMLHLRKKGLHLNELLYIQEEKLKSFFQDIPNVSEKDVERVALATTFYRLLNQKYKLDFIEMDNYLAQLKSGAFPDLGRLHDALAEPDLKKKIYWLLDYMEELKELILSPETYEIKEDIYKKRHITIDIPSMYGSYSEIKFDALGLAFRIESLINVLFEEIIEKINLNLITKATFFRIYDILRLFDKALKLDGISLIELERHLNLLDHSLKVTGFSFTQYLDIFKGFAKAVKNIINDYFQNVHEKNLNRILSQIPLDLILSKYLPHEGTVSTEKLKHMISEIFFRERIAMSLGLQQLDLFLSRILNTLFHQADLLPKDKLHLLLNYDPKWAMTPIEKASDRVSGIINLGAKGSNMINLMKFGLPVPSGFIITTEAFRCREILEYYPPAEENFKKQINQQISALEKATGRKFGDPKNPLLFSVRSGSAVSQPGMMDTFIDVGINENIAAGLANRTDNSWFAWDCYRRFLQCYGMSFDIDRDAFDSIISEFKQKSGIPYKRSFSGGQMKQVALAYKDYILSKRIDIVEEPFEQLYLIIKKVFGSWESSKARAYRQIMEISDDWGTAATVQVMIFGNLSAQSGTGVFFTHNPRWAGDILKLWGDFSLQNQGEDVVAGLVKTLPISVTQQDIETRETDITLETHFPEIYNALNKWANHLIYEKSWSPQEMEFTFESPLAKDLYLLQTRDMAMRERKKVLTFDIKDPKKNIILGHGIGVSGGAMSGRIVFSLDEIDRWRKSEPETLLILVRGDTVPDDIREIYAADGLLTARGGVTSHAAVVAHRLGKTCVVGCGNMVCDEKEKICLFDQTLFYSGDHLSIDGRQGSVHQGFIKVKEM